MNNSLLNMQRPPVFCPGCAHDRVVKELNHAFQKLELKGHEIVIVSDIGCSGLFDTFFNTHALHGLHGRALTYAAGLKAAQPDLNVIVTMGDGGLGIGGAHFLSACRRNMDITLLILNNFNYGMTGGQFSFTTPTDAVLGSSFLNQLEKPVNICQIAMAAGAAYVQSISAYDKSLCDEIVQAINFKGFSLMDIWGVCTGRYTKKNKLNPTIIDHNLSKLKPAPGYVSENSRPEYINAYKQAAQKMKPVFEPVFIKPEFIPPETKKQQIVILGGAGQRIITAGELICLSGLTGGLHASQKNDYPITVLRGHCVSEIILSKEKITFTGIEKPKIIIALADEGVGRRKKIFSQLNQDCLIIKAKNIYVPDCQAKIIELDFKTLGIKKSNWALASLGVMAAKKKIITFDMLKSALSIKFKNSVLKSALQIIEQIEKIKIQDTLK